VVLVASASAVFAEPKRFLSVPDSVVLGTAFRAVTDTPGEVAFVTEEGVRVADTLSFPVTLTRDLSVAVALLGVPSTLSPGRYALEIREDGAVQDRVPLRVEARDFARQRIALNRSLTALRADPDPRKVEQAKKLIAMVAQVNPEAVFSDGGFDLPVEKDYRRTSGYGDRRTYDYADGGTARAIHFGVDLAAETGTPVHAAAPGRVAFAGDRIVTGLSVVIEHLPGVYGLYYHLDDMAVAEGDRVARGERIGTIGATGLATGPHLHWEIRVSGVPVSPDHLLEEALLDRPGVYRDIFGHEREEGR
jgi:murein DD-endopeptidase MepM/ murein hydrolase activator NlpD